MSNSNVSDKSGRSLSSKTDKGTRYDISTDEGIAIARSDYYEQTVRGLKVVLADCEKAISEGDHKQVIKNMLVCSEAAYSTARGLGDLIAKRAMREYVNAGGVLPTDADGALELAKRLFPKGGDEVSPASVARKDVEAGVGQGGGWLAN